MKRGNSGETTSTPSINRLFPLLGTALLIVGALFVAVPVFSALPACLTMEGASALGCVPGGVSIFSSISQIWASPWAVVGICLGGLGFGFSFGHRFS